MSGTKLSGTKLFVKNRGNKSFGTLLYLPGTDLTLILIAGSTDFPSPPYPDSIVCPEEDPEGAKNLIPITILSIMSKVRIEAFCWGAVSLKVVEINS